VAAESAGQSDGHSGPSQEADGQECPSYLADAQSDLDEAWEIASRGPMPLFMVDIHLHRARLFGVALPDGSITEYPWESVEHDLREARRLIEKRGYGRRTEELEDAEAALLG